MNAVERNRLRSRALRIARSFKDVFRPGGPVMIWRRVAAAVLIAIVTLRGRAALRRWLYRTVLTSDGETLRIAAHHVLADLRDYSFGAKSAFDPDPIIMARRQGRRDVWLRITQYLNLDEEQVQKLMEIDDGI